MRLGKNLGKVIAALMPAIAAAPGAASACAMCGLTPGDHAERAFGLSVLAMLSAPYLTVAAVGGVLYLAWRKAQRAAKQ